MLPNGGATQTVLPEHQLASLLFWELRHEPGISVRYSREDLQSPSAGHHRDSNTEPLIVAQHRCVDGAAPMPAIGRKQIFSTPVPALAGEPLSAIHPL